SLRPGPVPPYRSPSPIINKNGMTMKKERIKIISQKTYEPVVVDVSPRYMFHMYYLIDGLPRNTILETPSEIRRYDISFYCTWSSSSSRTGTERGNSPMGISPTSGVPQAKSTSMYQYTETS
ncbi:Unknown protein, partial [Striga hermonthica]